MRNAPKQATSAGALVRLLARALVERPDDVSVSEQEHERELVIMIQTAPSDRGRIIGRNGRIIRAIRTLTALAAKCPDGRPFRVDVRQG